MANVNANSPGSGYGNPYLDSLIWGGKWTGGTIGYTFGSLSSLSNGVGYSWLSYEKAAFQQALQLYANVCNVRFAEVPAGQADIIWWLADSKSFLGTTSLGAHETPDGSVREPIYGWFNISASTWQQAYMHKGGYGFATIVHELGHGLGLAHPHDGGTRADRTTFPGVSAGVDTDLGDNSLNQGVWTTMGYNWGWNGAPASSAAWGWQATPMAFDIAALQKLYGANTSYNTGNNAYSLPKANGTGTFWSCIWDAGGSDTISAAGTSKACTINLIAATLTGENAGGFISRVSGIIGGFTIAKGVVIENATGGNGGDSLIGNGYANTLNGGAGNDTLFGGAGNDTYVVAVGDTINETIAGVAGGTDKVMSANSRTVDANVENLTLTGTANTNATGNALHNYLTGNSGNNTLTGGTGYDTLNGGAGNDTLNGGPGNDCYIVAAGDVINETTAGAAGGVDRVLSANSFTLSTNLENLTLTGTANTTGTGNGLDNYLTGNSGDNTLNGGAGNDTLDGGAGDDTLNGSSGNDTYIVATGDVVNESAGGGIDTLLSSNSRTLGANQENLTLTGTANTNAFGNNLDNYLTGNSGDNALTGSNGNDTLSGGAGDDTMSGGLGADTYIIGTGDMLIETPSGGTDTVVSLIGYTLGADLENLRLAGSDNVSGIGNSLANLLTGNSGNNTLVGNGGADSLVGADGNDTLAVSSAGFVSVDGGAGTDTLRMDGSGFALDLTSSGAPSVTGIEQINMIASSGSHSLTLSAADVVDMSDTDQVIIFGGAGDQVTTTGTWTAAGTQTIGSNTYNVYTSGGATLMIDTNIVQTVDT